jgi:hypothetical protein
MKTIEELKKMREQRLEEERVEDPEWYDKFVNCNFVSFNEETGNIILCDDYHTAKCYAERGGQVLVLDKEKIYTYKTKNKEEFAEYIKHQVRAESINKMNRYGL